jgi:ATP-dependent DNA ligase
MQRYFKLVCSHEDPAWYIGEFLAGRARFGWSGPGTELRTIKKKMDAGLWADRTEQEAVAWTYAFDILAIDGDDLRKLPLHLRKNHLARLLARRPEGIFVSAFERGEIGPDLFRKACEFGLVCKRRDSAYRPGRSPSWIKVKNRSHPATERVKEAFS